MCRSDTVCMCLRVCVSVAEALKHFVTFYQCRDCMHHNKVFFNFIYLSRLGQSQAKSASVIFKNLLNRRWCRSFKEPDYYPGSPHLSLHWRQNPGSFLEAEICSPCVRIGPLVFRTIFGGKPAWVLKARVLLWFRKNNRGGVPRGGERFLWAGEQKKIFFFLRKDPFFGGGDNTDFPLFAPSLLPMCDKL